MKPDPKLITLTNNIPRIKEMLMELILRPRRDLAKWARITKQTANVKIGYLGQHLASLVTGVEGERTGARGHDLSDRSEVKSCSRLDQLDKCGVCRSAVARIEETCPVCDSDDIIRNNDSKWLITVKTEEDLDLLLKEVPRIILIISDYPNYEIEDWATLQFQAFEIWPKYERHENFRKLMNNYYNNIFLPHIARSPHKSPAPKNLWPYSFQFYMCNPVRTFHCVVQDALNHPQIDILDYVQPTTDRSTVSPIPMPISVLNSDELNTISRGMSSKSIVAIRTDGLGEERTRLLELRDTDHAHAQYRLYERGVR